MKEKLLQDKCMAHFQGKRLPAVNMLKKNLTLLWTSGRLRIAGLNWIPFNLKYFQQGNPDFLT